MFLLALLFHPGCEKARKNKEGDRRAGQLAGFTEAEIFHEVLDVYIPFRSELRAGQIMDVTFDQKSRLIALLVDNGDKVKKGDLVASLMKVKDDYEYTPVEIHARFNGVVSGITYHVGSIIPAGERLMLIKDLSYLVTRVMLDFKQMPLIKRHNKVILQIRDKKITTNIDRVDRKRNDIQIVIGNKQEYLKEEETVNGKILCGPVSGSFLLRKYVQGDSMQVRLAEGIKLMISFPAFTEDKALIYPPIPDQNKLWIFK